MSIYSRQDRHLPVRPNLNQLKHQAKDLLRAIQRGDPAAIEELNYYHPKPVAPEEAKLADAQLTVARTYQAPSWSRLVQACKLIDAIWRDDIDVVRELVAKHPRLLHEHATIRDSNWGPPLSYAANLGRDDIVKQLHKFGAMDLEHAMGRAMLQSKISTAAMLYKLLGSPPPPEGVLGGPAYTLSVPGTAFALEIGAPVRERLAARAGSGSAKRLSMSPTPPTA